MKIGVFGGSFNPVHDGHVNLIKACKEQGKLDKVLLIPTNIPPHKTSKCLASNEDRYNMLMLATKKLSWVEVTDIEYKLGGVSYTVNTIKNLRKIYKNDEINLIIGSDMFVTFSTWVKYKKILKEINMLLVAARHEEEYEALVNEKEKYGKFRDKIEILKLNVVEASSTDIRDSLNKGLKPDRINSDVYNYIVDKNIY